MINKSTVPKQSKRRYRKGYGVTVDRVIGFKTILHRTTISRWRRSTC